MIRERNLKIGLGVAIALALTVFAFARFHSGPPILSGQMTVYRDEKFRLELAYPIEGKVERVHACSVRIRNFDGEVDPARLLPGQFLIEVDAYHSSCPAETGRKNSMQIGCVEEGSTKIHAGALDAWIQTHEANSQILSGRLCAEFDDEDIFLISQHSREVPALTGMFVLRSVKFSGAAGGEK
jgi:hypothetical protein